MKIAIVGAGNIGTTLGRRWTEAGHEVVFGARDPGSERSTELARTARVASISDALDGADAILLAVPGNALPELLDVHGERMRGVILDATNRMGGLSFHQIPLFEERLPEAPMYRAFNTLGWENFAEPRDGAERADLFYSGPEGPSQDTVEPLIADIGLRPVYVGAGSAGADLLDGMTRLWFALSMQRGHGRRVAFRTLGLK